MAELYDELRNDAIEKISTEKLYNKSIRFKNKDYVIVATNYYGQYLTLTLINKTEQYFNDEVVYAQTHKLKLNDYIAYLNRNNIDAIVMQISDPLLRDDSFDDFYICYGEDHPYLCYYSINNGVWAPFYDLNDNIITNIKNIQFPAGIKELRKAFFKAMSKERQEEYLQQYKDYCLTTIKQLLEEKDKLISRRLRELQQETNSLLAKKDKNHNSLLNIETKNNNVTL